MQINDIMTEYVEVIAPEISIEEAAKQMRSLNVGVYPSATDPVLWECSRIVTLRFER
jgi:hypothetical protein